MGGNLHLNHLLDPFDQYVKALIFIFARKRALQAGQRAVDDPGLVSHLEGIHFARGFKKISRGKKAVDELIFLFPKYSRPGLNLCCKCRPGCA